ncbi:hypothetical protein GGE07_006381 [Sinorhizobium terangae]|uniref:hypothetical protein n=1 Tax=Sinorhizobium terangae TaxID=110322 RepID=UPI00142EC838|nr:hypothetical protein [Sinorhizobium terangae]MBB4189684.1 hypothetical protein [Sinorhizobium terangae]
MGLIEMSERDLQRIEVLSKVVDGWTTIASAACPGLEHAPGSPITPLPKLGKREQFRPG